MCSAAIFDDVCEDKSRMPNKELHLESWRTHLRNSHRMKGVNCNTEINLQLRSDICGVNLVLFRS